MAVTSEPVESARPLLKWAGGKRQLLPALRRFYPPRFEQCWEPFLGSAAVFFDLHARGVLDGHAATLSDNNPDLIACYRTVRDQPEHVIEELSRLASGHQRAPAKHYYAVRDERFNPLRRALSLTESKQQVDYTPSLAAMFIYLNRTGYNGLFRLNAAGEFNVPAGRYSNPRICDADNLRRVAEALRRPGVDLVCRRFDHVAAEAAAGDFLYFDPPYAPLSRTANFTSYTAGGFNSDDQERIRQILIELARRGCHVVMSNSTAPQITALYGRSKEVAEVGLRRYRVPARRAINSNGKRRGIVEEYVITNVARNDLAIGD
jgi:DNA adenine methylase